jgi:AbiV family abortive infection protein
MAKKKAKKTLTGYNGLLNAKQVADGMNAARKHAYCLLSDAEILFENKRYSSALSLAILAIEEAGKISILRRLAIANSDNIRELWKEYRSHRSKNASWIIIELAKAGARTLSDLEECVNADGEHTALLDTLKQIGFYTDCYDPAQWSEPEKIIDKDLCHSIIKTAKTLCHERKSTEAREIELWIEHLSKNENSKKALMNWHVAMIAEGLTDISEEKMYRFVNDIKS